MRAFVYDKNKARWLADGQKINSVARLLAGSAFLRGLVLLDAANLFHANLLQTLIKAEGSLVAFFPQTELFEIVSVKNFVFRFATGVEKGVVQFFLG